MTFQEALKNAYPEIVFFNETYTPIEMPFLIIKDLTWVRDDMYAYTLIFRKIGRASCRERVSF